MSTKTNSELMILSSHDNAIIAARAAAELARRAAESSRKNVL